MDSSPSLIRVRVLRHGRGQDSRRVDAHQVVEGARGGCHAGWRVVGRGEQVEEVDAHVLVREVEAAPRARPRVERAGGRGRHLLPQGETPEVDCVRQTRAHEADGTGVKGKVGLVDEPRGGKLPQGRGHAACARAGDHGQGGRPDQTNAFDRGGGQDLRQPLTGELVRAVYHEVARVRTGDKWGTSWGQKRRAPISVARPPEYRAPGIVLARQCLLLDGQVAPPQRVERLGERERVDADAPTGEGLLELEAAGGTAVHTWSGASSAVAGEKLGTRRPNGGRTSILAGSLMNAPARSSSWKERP